MKEQCDEEVREGEIGGPEGGGEEINQSMEGRLWAFSAPRKDTLDKYLTFHCFPLGCATCDQV